eukprot:5542163-Amphidinium_carterae.1
MVDDVQPPPAQTEHASSKRRRCAEAEKDTSEINWLRTENRRLHDQITQMQNKLDSLIDAMSRLGG